MNYLLRRWMEPMKPVTIAPAAIDYMDEDIDFIFLIDGTGSMQPCMDSLKKNISVFLDALAGEQSPLTNWRGKIVTYRDEKVDGSSWFEDNPFVENDGTALKSQLNVLEAKGGGDEPESLLDALHKIATMEQTDRSGQEIDPYKWRYRSHAGRVVIVFTDSTFHERMSYPEGEDGTVDDLSHVCMTNKIILILYAPDHEIYDKLSALDKCQWEAIPEVDGDFVNGLQEFVEDQENFRNALEALAKSVTQSGETPEL